MAIRIAGAELPPAAVPALGFAVAIAVLGVVFATGIEAVPALVLLVGLALVGMVWTHRAGHGFEPGPGALVGVATYALHLAPVALTGTATFLGYNLLNDTAIHLALVDYIGDHGSRYLHQPPGSFGATIHDYVGTRYPLGSHELLAALKPVVGLDAALLYQPFLAFCAGIAATAIYALLRPVVGTRIAAFGAFAAIAGQLVFSFALQGSIKELAFIVCLAAAGSVAADKRAAPLVALPAIALYGIYGVYALPWIVPLALLTLLLTRPALRTVVIGVVLFLAGVAVLVPDSIHYYNHGHDVLTSGEELGPLAGPLKVIQVAGIWLNGDYRFFPSHSWITYLLSLAVIALALFGLARAIRGRQPLLLLAVVPALVAYVVTMPSASPYIDAKLLAILSPFVVMAAVVGLAAIPIRAVAITGAVVLGAAVLISDALAYRIALPAPTARLNELAQIDKRYAGQGPVLVNEFEEYVKHYMRRSQGSDPYETWSAGRAQLRFPKLKVAGHQYDLDTMTPSFVERWPLIVVRRSPVASRPPSNYDRVWSGRWYEVWKRNRPVPLRHVPLGRGTFDPTAPLDCTRVRALERQGNVIAAVRAHPRIIPVVTGRQLPPGWYRYGQDPRMLEIHKGGAIGIPVPDRVSPAGVWLRGRTTRADRVAGMPVPRSLQRIADWIDLGQGALNLNTLLERPKRSLRPGDAQPDIIGPIALVPMGGPAGGPSGRLVRGSELRQFCGGPADWIDVVSSNQSG